MLKRVSKFFKRNHPISAKERSTVISGKNHTLSAQMISKNARKVVEALQQAGFEAYIVGGSVRDLLLGLHPKDFDVATNAKPWEIKPLFNRARIIGRRFQIVHVQFGSDIIEVTTFRSNTLQDSKTRHRKQTDSGMLTRDNVFGTISEDASRRDLTVNALYYDPTNNSIHDFTNGLEDIDDRRIRIIGDPHIRFREDPVRMLRVMRFAAKLGFGIDPRTAGPISELAENLQHIPAPRLFDESLKLFMSGQGLATFKLLHEYQLFEQIFPQLGEHLTDDRTIKLIEQAFTNTDLRIRSNKRVTPAFIFAALLWPEVEAQAKKLQVSGNSATYALSKSGSRVISNQIPITAIPRRFTLPMREIWDLQLRLTRRAGQRAFRLMETPRFRAAYDFVLLREQAGENLNGLGKWWTAFQEADDDEKAKMIKTLGTRDGKPRGRRRRPPRNKPKQSH